MLLIATLLLGGCATTWIATQATGTQRAWEEGVRETSVPLPGVHERIAIKLPLGIVYEPHALGVVKPFELQCTTDQRAKDVVYRSAFRYGKRWKIMSGIMALTEGALAAVFLRSRDEKPEYWLYGGFLAADALVTTALFWIPRKEIYAKEERPVLTHVRSDCPDGMMLSIGADRFPVDAAGRIGEVAEAALDAWMSEPMGPLQLEVAGQVQRFEIGEGEMCVWRREHHRELPPCYSGVALRSVLLSFEVPVGALSTVAARDVQPM
ncbi:MAG: hypothetical protein H0T46_21145 [Deltaproteobacteria bacterium]|nr:hypothetical protein [Deltaproteobacteria bacterium]